MKFTLSVILDLIFFSALSFFVSIIWLRYFTSNNFLIIFLSVIITILISVLLVFIKYSRQKNRSLNKKNKFELNALKNFLITSKPKEVFLLLEKIFYLKRNSSEMFKTFNTFYFESNKNFFLGHNNTKLCYYFDSLTLNDTMLKKLILNNKSVSSLFILCLNKASSCEELLTYFNTNIKIISVNDFYLNLCKNLNLFKEEEQKKSSLKLRTKNFAIKFLNPSQAKNFLFCGIWILVGSFIVRYNIYYIVFSTILLSLAVFCKVRQKKEEN